MGLDFTEIIMDMEDEFGISIADRDASRMETVGELFDYVVAALAYHPARQSTSCVSARCFYEVRRWLLADRSVRPSRVRPTTRLDDLAPPSERGKVLKRLTRKLNLPDAPSSFVAGTGTREPRPGISVGELAAAYARRVPHRFFVSGLVDEGAVWNALRAILLKYAPRDPALVTRHTRIVNDLRLD
jgi:hypothetical protein